MHPPFEEFDHTADVGIIAYGKTIEQLFENAALGMFSLIAELNTITPDRDHEISVQAESRESLMVEWLCELLFMHDAESLIFTDFSVKDISHTGLRAIAKSGPLKYGETETLRQIKAVTFHGLEVKETDDGWQARILFDT